MNQIHEALESKPVNRAALLADGGPGATDPSAGGATPPSPDPSTRSDPSSGGSGTPLVPRSQYEALGLQLEAQLDALMMQVPGLKPVDKAAAKAQVAGRGIPQPFVVQALLAVESVPALGQVGDQEAMAEAIAFEQGFTKLEGKMKNFLSMLGFTMSDKKASSGKGALQVYSLAQVLAKDDPQNKTLTMCVDQMKTTLGRTGKKKKSRTTTPPVTATPVPAAPSAPAPAAPPHATSPASATQSAPAPQAAQEVSVSINPPGGTR